MAIIAIWHDKVVMLGGQNPVLPSAEDFRSRGLEPEKMPLVAKRTIAGTSYKGCWLKDMAKAHEFTDHSLEERGFTLLTMRELYHALPQTTMAVACYYYHFLHWLNRSKYCGQCGALLPAPAKDFGRQCRECHERFYAQISPAVIVGVVRDDRLLLAQHSRHATSGYRSLLAGFVEPQESLEQCVLREIKEEVGIDVTNLRYFGSQPWPFPGSLMIGYFAEGQSEILRPDGEEILSAAWFHRGELPKTPGSFSIAGKMISWFDEGGDPATLGTKPLVI